MALADLGLIFIIIAIVMFAVEAQSPGFFIGVPATAIMIFGIMGTFIPEMFFTIWSPIILTVGMTLSFAVSLEFYKRVGQTQDPETTTNESLIGATGRVLETVIPDAIDGTVEIRRDTWSATATMEIEVGARIRVIGAEGVHVVVERAEEPVSVTAKPVESGEINNKEDN